VGACAVTPFETITLILAIASLLVIWGAKEKP
jgi:hypothetical protein